MNAEQTKRYEEFMRSLGIGFGSNSIEPVIPTHEIVHVHNAADASIELDKPSVVGGDAFKGFTNIKTKIATKHEWSDLEPGEKSYCRLKRIEWDNEIQVRDLLALAKSTFNSLLTNFSEKTALHVMQLAINLRDPDNQQPVFSEQENDLLLLDGEVPEDNLSKVELFAGTANGVNEIGSVATHSDRQQLLTSYCFLAASLLRVVTKPAEKYTKISQHLRSNFRHFYKYDLKVTGFHPTVPALTALKDALVSTDVMKHTLYTLLYASEGTETGRDIKMFLFQIHLQFTGLHAFVLFAKCVETYKVEPIQLAEALNTPAFAGALEALSKLLENFVQKHEGAVTPKMWKYARIFDQEFFSELRTKHTVKFVAVLAYVIKAAEPTNNRGDILKIAKVDQLPLEAKQRAQLHSVVVRRLLMQAGCGRV